MSTPEEVLAGTSKFAVVCGDATAVLKSLPDNAAHVCYCDPPYGLSAQDTGDVLACLTAWLAGKVYTHHGAGFLCKDWDAFVPGPEAWREVYRVLKPGAYCVAFSSTRTVGPPSQPTSPSSSPASPLTAPSPATYSLTVAARSTSTVLGSARPRTSTGALTPRTERIVTTGMRTGGTSGTGVQGSSSNRPGASPRTSPSSMTKSACASAP